MAEINNSALILSIETSGLTCGVAVSRGADLVAEYSVYGSNLHDRLMAEFIKRLLNDLKLQVSDFDAVAVSSGPGSFTGLRIGGSIAKALCYDGRPALISVATLDSFAWAAREFALAVDCQEIISVVPSHKELVYYQAFDRDINPKTEVFFIDQEEFKKLDKPDVVFSGPAAVSIENGYKLPGLNRLTPRFIANLAYKYFLEGRFTRPEDFTPLYVQEFQPKSTPKKSK